MKKKMILVAAAYACVTQAQILQYQYSDGTAIYSDRLPSNLQTQDFKKIKIKNKKTGVIETISSDCSSTSDTALKTLTTRNVNLTITAPHDGQTFWNNTITISLLVEPKLDPNNLIQIYLDGAPQGEPSNRLTQSISNLNPGTHELWTEIKDQKGVTVKASSKITFYVHQQTNEL